MTEIAPIAKPDRNRPEPLWHQAEQALRGLIADGTWTDGMQIPNEERLSTMLGVSRITIRHALRNIEDSGLLRREHGRGTFVRSSTVIAGVRGLTSFTQEMAGLGLIVGSRILERDEQAASAEVASALEIRQGEPVVRLRRLRMGNDAPIGVQTAYMPLARVPGFLALEPSASLYQTLSAHFGIAPREAREVYRVGTVAAEDAALLGIETGSPAFVVERITSDAIGPFEFVHSIMRGDRYEIRSRLHI
ncbi:GntR family transcriptional regulator [Neoaquamicrobium sediminum]|uniref:GntR family transcriptional regulator n=1 Tax=Neoaquamicrobium sediminum TaxID=1849104 RepID=A0ABV3WVK7_9HYPH|nr:GntR family transcriptional regulator [Mesorhizobium sediminum]NRC54004.1 GntR family transcriptional regulator [Mesorhizobium sediminum]